MLHHHRAQLGERVTHSVAAKERREEELTKQASIPRSRAGRCVWHVKSCNGVCTCMSVCLLLCMKISEISSLGYVIRVSVRIWVLYATHSDSWVKACSTTTLRLCNSMENVNDIEEGLYGKYWGVSVHRTAHKSTFLCDQGLSSSSASSPSSSASLQLTGESIQGFKFKMEPISMASQRLWDIKSGGGHI